MQDSQSTLLQISHMDSPFFLEQISHLKLHSEQIIYLYLFLLHLLHIGLKHLKHLFPQLFSECLICLQEKGL